MTAAPLTAPAPESADTALLWIHRDDGPLAAVLGRVLGPRVPVSPIALVVLAAAPMLAIVVATGRETPHGLVLAAVAWAVLAGGVSSGRPLTGPVRWAVPPALRAIEYGGLLWIAQVAGTSSLPAVFLLECVIAYHHYDTAYGQRHRRQSPPRWVQEVAGGWDGRLLVATVLLLAGALPAGFYVAAALLAPLFLGETIAEWRRVEAPSAPEPGEMTDEEDEEEEAG
jgi:hypothetical protein